MRTGLALSYQLLFFILIGLAGCINSKTTFSRRNLASMLENNPVFSQHHCGFVLFDPTTEKTIYSYNGERYFTPASNTKIFTLYTSLRILGDSVPALRYVTRPDSIIFWGTGDPSFLHPDLQSTRAYNFLNQRKEKLLYAAIPYEGEHLGPGWAWDDYNDAYSAEKSAFPLFGNLVRFGVKPDAPVLVQPGFFASYLQVSSTSDNRRPIIERSLSGNAFTYRPAPASGAFTRDVPFNTSSELLLQLLSDTLNRQVTAIPFVPFPDAETLYSLPTDSIYKRMMQESDNFLAEQLLLLCSSVLSGQKKEEKLSSEHTIAYAKKEWLADLPDKPVWIDGSGLSRYNLFTPRSLVALWMKLYQQVPRERLFSLLATGGLSGTLKNSYQQPVPYIYGKTGSLSNNHCLSGFLLTQSGQTLVFSFMHSNFVRPTAEIRREMERILLEIHQKY
jgi:D-alanyl-D-alanine carboxypeptidase/D-alanyl-D-alanine-endopeptidase (penicillin-binding protein 4)